MLYNKHLYNILVEASNQYPTESAQFYCEKFIPFQSADMFEVVF